MTPGNWGLIAAGGAFVALFAYMAHNESNPMQPRHDETADSSVNPQLGFVIDQLDTGSHYFHPNHCIPGQSVRFTPHRYPTTGGAEITTVIHRGLSAMAKPAPQDNDWRVMPPAGVQW
jgi:hypothetical protein